VLIVLARMLTTTGIRIWPLPHCHEANGLYLAAVEMSINCVDVSSLRLGMARNSGRNRASGCERIDAITRCGQTGAALEPLYELHKRFILNCRVVPATRRSASDDGQAHC
jgi:hypothetical protein